MQLRQYLVVLQTMCRSFALDQASFIGI